MVEIIIKIDSLINELIEIRSQAIVFSVAEFFYKFSCKSFSKDNNNVLASQVKYSGHVNIVVIDGVLCIHFLLKLTDFGIRGVKTLVHRLITGPDETLNRPLRIQAPEKEAVGNKLPADCPVPSFFDSNGNKQSQTDAEKKIMKADDNMIFQPTSL